MTLEEYFRDALSKNIIDHVLRVCIGPSGQPEFYIHPQLQSGRTEDYVVEKGTCFEKANCVRRTLNQTLE